EPTGLSKALGLSGRAVDLLDHRGLLPRFRACEPPNGTSFRQLFHFGGIPIDVRKLEGEPPKFVFVLQAVTERLLAERAMSSASRSAAGRSWPDSAKRMSAWSSSPARRAANGVWRRDSSSVATAGAARCGSWRGFRSLDCHPRGCCDSATFA